MRHDTLFAANLHLLAKHHPAAARKIQAGDRPIAARLLPKATSQPNLLVTDSRGTEILLHQPDPENESSTYLAKVPKDSHGTVVLFGLGLGYHAQAILHHRPNLQRMIIFERHPALFRRAMELVDLAPLLTDPRVILLLGPDPASEAAFDQAAMALQLEDIHILRHLPSFAIDPSYIQLHDTIFPLLNGYNVAGSSAMRQGRRFLANRLANFATIDHLHTLDVLTGAARGRPAVLIANGPSLDDDLEPLARYRDRAIYFAVDSCVPTLLAHGIVPDFVGALDANPVIYEKLAETAVHLESCAIICSSQVTPEIVDHLPVRNVFVSFGPSTVETHFAPLVGTTTREDNTPTVAHLNLLAALRMGAGPIIFVGQDLGYPDHSRTHSSATKLTCTELVDKTRQTKDDFMTIAGVRNTTVQTDRGLFNAKSFLEEIIRRHPNRYINATSRGAAIAGTEERSLEEALASLPALSSQDRILVPQDHAQHQTTRRRQAILDEYTRLLAECRQVRAQLHEARARTRAVHADLRQANGTGISAAGNRAARRITAGIQTIDNLMRQINGHHHLWLLLQDLTLKGLKYCNRIRHRLSQEERAGSDWRRTARLHLAWFSVAANAQLQATAFLQRHLEHHIAFLREEETLMAAPHRAIELLDFYLHHDKIKLAHRLLTDGPLADDDSAAAWLARGIIAGVYRQPGQQRRCLDTARALDPTTGPAIEAVYRRMGDRFLALARECPDLQIDRTSALRLLADGLVYGDHHAGCLEELVRHAAVDARRLGPAPDEATLRHHSQLLTVWADLLQTHPVLHEAISASDRGLLLLGRGRLALLDDQADEAVTLLRQAVDLLPDAPQAIFALAQALIHTGSHLEGIALLDKAVALDRSYGYYWETLGDVLFQAGLYPDAAAAYERGFLALPEHAIFLRKMGDCYRATGQSEAATEAYRHFQQRTTQSMTSATSP